MRATPEIGLARREDDLLVEDVKNDNSFQASSPAMLIGNGNKRSEEITAWIMERVICLTDEVNTSRHTYASGG